MDADKILTDAEKRTRVFFVSSAFVLLSVITIALVYLATGSTTAATATLSAGGVSNIFLPCILPLAFVIVPMSMGQGYRVLSTPGIVINGKLEYTGGLDETAFREHLKKLSGG